MTEEEKKAHAASKNKKEDAPRHIETEEKLLDEFEGRLIHELAYPKKEGAATQPSSSSLA